MEPNQEQREIIKKYAKIIYSDFLCVTEHHSGEVSIVLNVAPWSVGFQSWQLLAEHLKQKLYWVKQQMQWEINDVAFDLLDVKPDYREARGVLWIPGADEWDGFYGLPTDYPVAEKG